MGQIRCCAFFIAVDPNNQLRRAKCFTFVNPLEPDAVTSRLRNGARIPGQDVSNFAKCSFIDFAGNQLTWENVCSQIGSAPTMWRQLRATAEELQWLQAGPDQILIC